MQPFEASEDVLTSCMHFICLCCMQYIAKILLTFVRRRGDFQQELVMKERDLSQVFKDENNLIVEMGRKGKSQGEKRSNKEKKYKGQSACRGSYFHYTSEGAFPAFHVPHSSSQRSGGDSTFGGEPWKKRVDWDGITMLTSRWRSLDCILQAMWDYRPQQKCLFQKGYCT